MQKIIMADEREASGYATYRCTMCDGIAFKMNARLSERALARFLVEGANEVEGVPREIVHRCENGCRGIASIIGIATAEIIKEGCGSDAVN